MSAKWVRSKKWDDQHLTGALLPVKLVLRTFSSIPLAVVLLSFVAIYGTLASIPLGLLAIVPTKLLYAAIFLALFAVVMVLPLWLITRRMRAGGASLAQRFVASVFGVLILGSVAFGIWVSVVWPMLRYDAIAGTGVRLFAKYVDDYSAVQMRRLPGMEMSELEFYSWWPLTLVLSLFVINMITATVRRIEFSVPNIGVLTVHSGIITIALGSLHYSKHKQEGDMLLLAGTSMNESGRPIAGQAERGFYDNTRTALWVTMLPAVGWEQRPLSDVPRYNDYNLDVLARSTPRPGWSKSLWPLDLRVPGSEGGPNRIRVIDEDLSFRIVGYCSYGELQEEWVVPPAQQTLPIGPTTRLREVEARASMPVMQGGASAEQSASKLWQLTPDLPRGRADVLDTLSVEYTIGMSDERWADLTTRLPELSRHALVVRVPGTSIRNVYPVEVNSTVQVGDTGYTLTVQQIEAQPPFPIVTKGYEGANSSLAVVRVQAPAAGDKPAAAFDRWIYARFPEIAQDMLEEKNAAGMPKRRAADGGIDIRYIDASLVHVVFDERADGTIRALVRLPGQDARVIERVAVGEELQVLPALKMSVKAKQDKAVRVEVPVVISDEARDKQRIGNHQASSVAVEISDKAGNKVTRWVPFSQYVGIGGPSGPSDRTITMPDGRLVHVVFGRVKHEFWPPMSLRLHDFQMMSYPHSTTPRDYKSEVVVSSNWGNVISDSVRSTSLNNPLLLRTPYVAPEGMPLPGRLIGHFLSFLSPNQYKFSQTGWDQMGWRQTEQQVAEGTLQRPFARFTILGVGNNPGIYIIAVGAIMMSCGIPWAFYLKPVILKRRKEKIAAAVKAGTYVPPKRAGQQSARNGTHAADTGAAEPGAADQHAENTTGAQT